MIITVDIGGTNFRIAKFSSTDHTILRLKTPNYLDGLTYNEINSEIINILSSEISKYPQEEIEAVGISFPGPVTKDGEVWGGSAIYGEELDQRYDFKSAILSQFELPHLIIQNDLTAATYFFAELYPNFSLITVSSGIGGKVVIGGEVQISEQGIEGEIGHIPSLLCPEVSIPCSCGTGTNHIGCISSGRGIADVANLLKESILNNEFQLSSIASKTISTEELLQAADQNDMFSKHVIDYCVKPLAYEINSLLAAMYLEKIILIGGVASNSAYYVDAMKQAMLNFGVYNFDDKYLMSKVEVAKGDDYGLLGMKKYIEKYVLATI